MEKEKVVKATLSPKAKGKAKKQEEDLTVSLDAQRRLAEILNDSPRLVSLNGTEWEVRALRMGTQWLIAKIVADMAKEEESKTFGDIIKQFSINIPAILDVLTLCLLNDKAKIFEGGNPNKGYSKLYHATRNTLEWDCEVSEFGNLLFECLQLMDVDFFLRSRDILEIFKKSALEKKRTRIAAQRSSKA